LKSAGLLALAAACWGLGTVMTKHALSEVPPFTLPVVQLAASSLFLWIIAALQGLRLPARREAMRLALTGLLEPGATITFAVLGLRLTTASMTTLIFATQPALVVALAWLMLGERLSRTLMAFSLVAVAGVALVAGSDVITGGVGSMVGNLLVIVSLICCSIYLVISRRLVTCGVEPVVLVALQQTVGLAWTLLIWPVELLNFDVAALAKLGAETWLWAAASGVTYYGLGFWFYVAGLKQVPASLAALFLALSPIFGIGGAYLALGERLEPVQWIGAALILAAMVAIARTPAADTPQPSPAPNLDLP
jgi:drug/metabolite transporter (DMT)-like permease